MQTEPTAPDKEKKPPTRRMSPLRRYGILAGTVWLIIIVVAWFRIHPPFYLEPITKDSDKIAAQIAQGVGLTFANLLLLFGLAVGCGALGIRLLELARYRAGSGLEKALFGCGVGLGAFIFLVLLIGVLGGLNTWVMLGLLVATLGLNYPQTGWMLQGLAKLARNIWNWFIGASWWEKTLAIYLGVTFVIPLLVALGPTYSWDGLMYHLAAPKIWVQRGRVDNIFEMPPASYPFGIEMLYTWALALTGDGLAQAIHWLFLPLGSAAIWLTATRYFTALESLARQGAALLAVTLYCSVPHIQLLASWPYTDLLIAFYATLGVYAMFRALEELPQKSGSAIYIALAGICGGLAFSGKYTAVTTAAAILLTGFYLAGANKQLNWRLFWGWSVLFGSVALIVAAPWLIRNFFFTGNPIAPIFWGVNGWHPDEIAPIVGKGAGQPFSLEMILGRPFKAAIFGTAGGTMDATITPLYLALLPVAAYFGFKQKIIASFWFNIGFQYLCWIAVIVSTAQLDHTRILLPTFPFLALVSGYALVALFSTRSGMLKTFAPLVVAIFLLGNLLNLGLFFATDDTVPYLTGIQTKEAYLENIVGSQIRAARFVNEKLPASSFTFFLFEPRSYYYDHHVAPDLNGGEWFYFLDNLPTAELTRDELKRRGVTHILLNEAGLKFFQENPDYARPERAQAATKLWEDFRSKYLKLVYQEKGEYSIYELN